MVIEQNAGSHLIERSLLATEQAIKVIEESDSMRRQSSLDLRDMQLTLHEDFERLRGLMSEFEEQLEHGASQGSKWMENKLAEAKTSADQTLSSVLMVQDVQTLEKKVNLLKESMINMNKAYYNYEKQVDMRDLMDQVTEMVYRTEKKEKELTDGKIGGEEAIEAAFRGAIEGLYGLKSANPKLMEEAKQLAGELRVFRDAAANKNFYTMISKSEAPAQNSGSSSTSGSSEESFSSTSAQNSSSQASSAPTTF